MTGAKLKYDVSRLPKSPRPATKPIDADLPGAVLYEQQVVEHGRSKRTLRQERKPSARKTHKTLPEPKVIRKKRREAKSVAKAYGPQLRIDTTKVIFALAEKGLSIADVAKNADAPVGSINRAIKRGYASPKIAGRLAKGLGVPLSEIAEVME